MFPNIAAVLQSLSRVWLFETPWTATCQAPLFSSLSQSLFKFMSIESVMLSNHLILSHPLPFLLSFFPRVRVFFQWVGSSHQTAKNWSFSISPSKEYSGLISFRIDWFNLLAVQGTLNSLLQNHNAKATVLRCSAFFMVQLSHWYLTTRKTSSDYTDLCQQSDISAF